MTNTTFRLCPWADVLYALDLDWWKVHLAEVRRTFGGELISPQRVDGVRREVAWLDRRRTNSGAALIAQAAYWGVRRIVLIGYDCGHDGRTTHWHGSHPSGLKDAAGADRWPAQFASIVPRLSGTTVINASRHSALTLWPRRSLKEALA